MNIKLTKKKVLLLLHSAIVLVISYIIVSCFIFSTKSLSFFGVIDESGDVPMSDIAVESARLKHEVIDLNDKNEKYYCIIYIIKYAVSAFTILKYCIFFILLQAEK